MESTNNESRCYDCGGTLYAPYRRFAGNGAGIMEGCVSAFHDAAYAGVSGGTNAEWHNRPEAKAVRKARREYEKSY